MTHVTVPPGPSASDDFDARDLDGYSLWVDVVSVIPRDMRGRYLMVEQLNRLGEPIPSFPGGRIETGETPTGAFRREAIEELSSAVNTSLTIPAYEVRAQQARVKVFEAGCASIGDDPRPQTGDKVRRAFWVEREEVLRRFLLSPCRHISEPFLVHASGHGRGVHWRYDARSAHLSLSPVASENVIVGGHFAVRGHHTEILGTPAGYLREPESLAIAALSMARFLAPYNPTSLIAPAVGGIPLATQVSVRMKLPLTIVDPRKNGQFTDLRGAPLTSRPAFVDSTYHTGKTVADVVELVERRGSEVVAGAVAIRSIVTNTFTPMNTSQVPVHGLNNILVHSWEPGECPKCEANEPINLSPARH